MRNQLVTALSMAWSYAHTITVGYYVPMNVTHYTVYTHMSISIHNYEVNIDHNQISLHVDIYI